MWENYNLDKEAHIRSWDTTDLRITACSCALLTLSVDGNPVSSQSSGLSLLQAKTSFFRQLSSFSCKCNPFICSFIVKSGPINHSNTLSLGRLSLVNSISSAAWLTLNVYHILTAQHWMNKMNIEKQDWKVYIKSNQRNLISLRWGDTVKSTKQVTECPASYSFLWPYIPEYLSRLPTLLEGAFSHLPRMTWRTNPTPIIIAQWAFVFHASNSHITCRGNS